MVKVKSNDPLSKGHPCICRLEMQMGNPAMGCEDAGRAWELKLPKSFSAFPSQLLAFKNAPDQTAFHRATKLLSLAPLQSSILRHFLNKTGLWFYSETTKVTNDVLKYLTDQRSFCGLTIVF